MAVTLPRAELGFPPAPRALPRAVTRWPTLTVDELPSATGRSWDAPLNCSTATSLETL